MPNAAAQAIPAEMRIDLSADPEHRENENHEFEAKSDKGICFGVHVGLFFNPRAPGKSPWRSRSVLIF